MYNTLGYLKISINRKVRIMTKTYDREYINNLKCKANSWDRMARFFENSEEIQEYYQDAIKECRECNCHSEVIMMIVAIEKALEKIEELKDR